MAKNYGKVADQKASYLAKEELLKSRFEQVAPMDFYREIFDEGCLQKIGDESDGLGTAIFRFQPDRSTYKKIKARMRGEYQDELFKDSDLMMQRFAKMFDALPADADEELNKRFDELDKQFNAGAYRKPGQPIETSWKFDQRVHDDLSELGEAIGKRFAIMAPMSYFGIKANSKNARYLYALVIDVDGVGVEQLKHIINGIVDQDYYMCCPTYIVNSGHGVHLYYVLEEPIPCYKNLREPITRLKNGIARMVWNDRTSTISGHRDDQPWGQMYRVVGSLSKLGTGYPATAYRTGKPVDIMQFNDYIFDEYKIKPLDSYKPVGASGHDLEYWKEHNPKWYKEKILHQYDTEEVVGGKFPWLYEKLVPKVRLGAKVGTRYHSMCVLFADAALGGIPYSQVYETCIAMVDFLNRDADKDNQFTVADVECAAKYYTTSFGRWLTLDRIEAMTELKFERNKRNGNKQPVHCAMMRATKNVKVNMGLTKDTRFGADEGNTSGRKIGSKDSKPRNRTADSKEQVIRAYLQDHPDAKKVEVIRETGLSKPTVYKWYDRIKAEGK